MGRPHSPHPPRSINSRRGSGFLPPRASSLTHLAICEMLRMNNSCLSSPFHRDNSAKQPLIVKTSSVITFPQNHLSSTFYFSSSSFSCCRVSLSLLSKNDSVVFLSWQMQPRKHSQQTVHSINPTHIARN